MKAWQWNRQRDGAYTCHEIEANLGAPRVDIGDSVTLTSPGMQPVEAQGARIIGTLPPLPHGFAASPTPTAASASTYDALVDSIMERRKAEHQAAFRRFWGNSEVRS